MTLGRRWLIPVAIVGATATLLAAGLFWALITRPMAAAQFLGGL
ncbi:MAG TPA: hypothetical protein VN700_05690 [Vicinamibacterales bacterium]|nr:hypothetical protein [Vicinamibacterales bacterium]